MTVNYPGPGEVRIFYNVTCEPGGQREHVMRLSFIPTDVLEPEQSFAEIQLVRKDSTPSALSVIVDLLVTRIVPFFNASDAIVNYAECWAYEPDTFDAIYISAYQIGEVGTNLDPTYPASQVVTTFRTQEGGIMRVTLMDTAQTPGVPILYGQLEQPFDDFADHFFLATKAYWVARDTSFPVACLRLLPGQSEHLFKSRFR